MHLSAQTLLSSSGHMNLSLGEGFFLGPVKLRNWRVAILLELEGVLLFLRLLHRKSSLRIWLKRSTNLLGHDGEKLSVCPNQREVVTLANPCGGSFCRLDKKLLHPHLMFGV